MPECPHGEIDASCCMDCIDGIPPEKAKTAPARPAHGDGYVVAVFEGFCPECEQDVLVGDKIIEIRPGRWGHQECAT